jgi:chromosome segregation ATPase
MTTEQTVTYRQALNQARDAFQKASKRLNDLNYEAHQLKDEIGRLRRTITALSALCTEEPGLDNLGITESCMEVMESQKGELTTSEVVMALDLRGFDIDSQQNPAASVHRVLQRLAFKNKITRVDGESGVRWRGPNYDPNYVDEIPF